MQIASKHKDDVYTCGLGYEKRNVCCVRPALLIEINNCNDVEDKVDRPRPIRNEGKEF